MSSEVSGVAVTVDPDVDFLESSRDTSNDWDRLNSEDKDELCRLSGDRNSVDTEMMQNTKDEANSFMENYSDNEVDYSDEGSIDGADNANRSEDEDYAPGKDGSYCKNFSCEFCGRGGYGSKNSRRMHYVREHKEAYLAAKEAKILGKDTESSVQRRQSLATGFRTVSSYEPKFDEKRPFSGFQMESSYGSEFPCKHCPFSYKNIDALRKHMRSKHEGLPGLEKKSLTVSVQRAEAYGTEFPCPHCTFSYKMQESLRHHMQHKHKELVGRTSLNVQKAEAYGTEFPCKHCTFSYKRLESLQKHMLKKHRDLPGLERRSLNVQKSDSYGTEFPCKHCTFSYKKLESLQKHMQLKHKGLPGLKRKSSLNVQKDYSWGTKFPCHYCTFSYNNYESRERHKQRKHKAYLEKKSFNVQKPYAYGTEFPCNYCSFSYNNEESRLRHVTKKHKALYLRDEKRSNQSGNQPESSYGGDFPCNQCTNSYKHESSLAAHMRNSHFGEKDSGNGYATRNQLRSLGEYNVKQNANDENNDGCTQNYSDNDVFANDENVDEVTEGSKSASEGTNDTTDDVVQISFDDVENGENDFTPPAAKRPTIMDRTDSSRTNTSIDDIEVLEIPNIVKVESDYIHEVKPITHKTSNIIVAQTYEVKRESLEATPVLNYSTSSQGSCSRSTTSLRKDATKIYNDIFVLNETKPLLAVDSDSDDCMIIEPETPINKKMKNFLEDHNCLNNFNTVRIPSSASCSASCSSDFINISSLNNSFVADHIEKSRLPLSAAIFTRSIQFPKELMVVWSNSLEEDLLAAVSMNSSNSILFVQELDTLTIPKPQRDLMTKGQTATFNMLDSNDTFTLWTVISFDQKNCQNSLKRKLFRSFAEVEKVLFEHAEGRGMTINNIMRHTDDGIFSMLSQVLTKKVMACNYVE